MIEDAAQLNPGQTNDKPHPAPAGLAIAWTVARRELIHFMRQRGRIAAAVGTPLLVWLFLAAGFADSLRPQSVETSSYAAYLLPGMMTLVATFAAIFAGISIIEDRNSGWLQSVLVSPAPRWSIALGRITGGSIVAFVQAGLLMLALPLTDADISTIGVVVMLLALAVTCMAMTAMGLMLAWRTETTASFHAVMNMVFMPMWLLSGAFFAAEGASPWLRWLMLVNPLTWCTEAMRAPLDTPSDPSLGWLAAAAAFAAAMCIIAIMTIAARGRPR